MGRKKRKPIVTSTTKELMEEQTNTDKDVEFCLRLVEKKKSRINNLKAKNEILRELQSDYAQQLATAAANAAVERDAMTNEFLEDKQRDMQRIRELESQVQEMQAVANAAANFVREEVVELSASPTDVKVEPFKHIKKKKKRTSKKKKKKKKRVPAWERLYRQANKGSRARGKGEG